MKLKRTADLSAVAADYGLRPQPLDRVGSRPIYRMRIVDGMTPPKKAAQLAADRKLRVVYAEPNHVGQTPGGDVNHRVDAYLAVTSPVIPDPQD